METTAGSARATTSSSKDAGDVAAGSGKGPASRLVSAGTLNATSDTEDWRSSDGPGAAGAAGATGSAGTAAAAWPGAGASFSHHSMPAATASPRNTPSRSGLGPCPELVEGPCPELVEEPRLTGSGGGSGTATAGGAAAGRANPHRQASNFRGTWRPHDGQCHT